MGQGVILTIFLWIIYFVIHSVFASNYVKLLVEKRLPSLYRYYRLVYVLFAIGFLFLILMVQSLVNHQYIYQKHIISTLAGLVLATWGILIIKSAFKYYNMKEFLGLQQLTGEQEDQGLLRKGILNLVRHPIYTGTILMLAGYFIFDPTLINLITVLCMVFYILVGIQLEEKKLLKQFGDQYKQYRKEVPMLFPDIKRLTNFFNRSLTP